MCFLRFLLAIGCVLLVAVASVEAQAPEQDCINAINLCSPTYSQGNAYAGIGQVVDVPPGSSCLQGGETNSVWYTFTVAQSGLLSFQLIPVNQQDDYDFALYTLGEDGCAAIADGTALPLRCNYSSTVGNTGLSDGFVGVSEGSSGPNQCAPLEVEQGQTLAMLVSNFTASQGGYSLDFSGSAVMGDQVAADVFAGQHMVPDADKTNRSTYEMLGIAHDDGTFPTLTPSVVNYLPGVSPSQYPSGIGIYRLPRKGAFLIKNMHYGPSPVDAFDRSHINVFYADGPPERPLRELMLGTLGVSPVVPRLIVPPDSVMTVHTRLTLTEDISLLTINPHMHLIGRSFLAYALLPQGDTVPLIRIPKWDFRWQYFYTFKNMVKLPKGTIIHAEGVYDNTRDNPNNPFDPPRAVFEPLNENMRTTDEMFQFIISYLSYREGDEHLVLGQ
jgi:hypothetical protein